MMDAEHRPGKGGQFSGAPEARPLCSVDELLQWEPGSLPDDEMLMASVPLPAKAGSGGGGHGSSSSSHSSDRPLLLACHDMRGGYLDDRFPQGTGDAQAYSLTAWPLLDLFVYFSHRLVTIPPPGWINAAHRHGVPCLGTLITEWEAGAAACARLFGSANAAAAAARQLAAIASHYRFEGWLINIENKMAPEHIPHLLHFLRKLTALMHEAVPGSRVVWYDAVTTAGELKWQDSLTDLNRPFFDACDGLFVNYTWKRHTPAAVQAAAGARAADVFMGVDCFGRNTYGGGRMECRLGLAAAAAAGLSAALFAPAWPYECDDAWPGCEGWKQRNALFWRRIAAACHRRPPTLLALPFQSDFSLGSGRGLMQQGWPLHSHAWYNLSRTAPQPLLEWRPPVPADARAVLSGKAAFSGGTSVHLSGSGLASQRLRLFEAEAPLPPAGLRASLVVASSSSALLPCLRLEVQGLPGGDIVEVIGVPFQADEHGQDTDLVLPALQHPLAPPVMRAGSRSGGGGSGSCVGGSGASEQRLRWVEYTTTLHPHEHARLAEAAGSAAGDSRLLLRSVDLELLPAAGAAHGGVSAAEVPASSAPCELWLGDVALVPLDCDALPRRVAGLSASEVVLEPGLMPGPSGGCVCELSLLLRWRPPQRGGAPTRYHVWVQEQQADDESGGSAGNGAEGGWQWVGMAHAPAFRVSHWRVDGAAAPRTLRFAVQAVGQTGPAESLEDASTVDVQLPLDEEQG